MTAFAEAKTHYLDLFQQQLASAAVRETAARQALRKRCIEKFSCTDFPTRYQENWKYSSVYALAEKRFVLPKSVESTLDIESMLPLDWNGWVAVFHEGILNTAASRLPTQQGVLIASLQTTENYDQYLGKMAAIEHNFDALNLSLLNDGLIIHLQPHVKLDKPLLILHSGSPDKIVNYRHVTQLEEGAFAEIIEVFHGDSGAYFTNHVNEIILAKGANLSRVYSQQESKEAYHISTTVIHQAADSQVTQSVALVGAAWSRVDVKMALNGQGAGSTLQAFSLLDQQQHADLQTTTSHNASHTTATERVKNIIKEKAHGVFNGCIYVKKETKGSVSLLQNHNLLLSRTAKIDTKPELKIFADDVKCSHGATVGQLDQTALFYLQSRGISKADAEQLLLSGFINEIVEAIPVPQLITWLKQIIANKLTIAGEKHDNRD